MTQALSKATYDGAVLGVSAPPTPGMLHLGIGNFHRAHAASRFNRNDVIFIQSNRYFLIIIEPGLFHLLHKFDAFLKAVDAFD